MAGLPYAMRLWFRLPEADVTSFHAPFSFLLRRKKSLGVCTHTIHRTPKWIVRLYGKMDRIYAGSYATVREAKRVAPHLTGILKAIHNCVELPGRRTYSNFNGKRACSLLYVGRFVRDKGLETLIGSVIDACRAGCSVRLTTVGPQCDGDGGNSEFFEKMNKMIAERRMESRFEFVASTTDRERHRQVQHDFGHISG